MNSWVNDVDESNEESSDDGGFEATLQRAIDMSNVGEIDEIKLAEGIGEVEDENLISQALTQVQGNGHDQHVEILENRLSEVTPTTEEEETETPPESTGLDPTQEDMDSKAQQPTLESMAESESGSAEETIEPNTSQSEPTESVQAEKAAPQPNNSIPIGEAAEKSRRWKVMAWGEPGLFKTHFAYTMPEPIAYIDTEGKAHDIAHKFAYKEIQMWQPTDFRECQSALQEALEWLDWWRENENEIGTIVVDSMSLIWEWAKTAYKKETNPMTDDLSEVTLSANIGSSGESDWPYIKGMHNSEFREWITDSPYHFLWTAMEKDDIRSKLEGDTEVETPVTDEGEKNNEYKVDTAIRARKDAKGRKVGDLTKSNLTDNLFVGLEKPTFGKFANVIQTIEEAETEEGVKKSELEDELGVEIVQVNPQYYIQEKRNDG